jgi:hypothetical protein
MSCVDLLLESAPSRQSSVSVISSLSPFTRPTLSLLLAAIRSFVQPWVCAISTSSLRTRGNLKLFARSRLVFLGASLLGHSRRHSWSRLYVHSLLLCFSKDRSPASGRVVRPRSSMTSTIGRRGLPFPNSQKPRLPAHASFHQPLPIPHNKPLLSINMETIKNAASRSPFALLAWPLSSSPLCWHAPPFFGSSGAAADTLLFLCYYRLRRRDRSGSWSYRLQGD